MCAVYSELYMVVVFGILPVESPDPKPGYRGCLFRSTYNNIHPLKEASQIPTPDSVYMELEGMKILLTFYPVNTIVIVS